MLRANEIGADVHSTTETELDKNNLSTQKNETEHRFEYPELGPGRALIDIETGALYEIMHRAAGFTDTVEGRQSEYEERMDWKYRTPKGQDWGGIIQHYFLSYAKRDCPSPNEHGELPTPISRPTEEDITDVRPGAFRENVLFDGDLPRPFLIVERPEVTYEELIPGDTYTILGWYDPSEADADDRVKPVGDIGSMHPDIAGVDYDIHRSKHIPGVDITVQWDDVSGTDAVHIDREETNDDSVAFSGTVLSRTADIHITRGSIDGYSKFMIDSPYDAKEDIKSLSVHARWASEQKLWAVDANTDVLCEMITEFTDAGWDISIAPTVIDDAGDLVIDVVPEHDVAVTMDDIVEHMFTEEIEVDSGVELPGVPVTVDLDSIDADVVALAADDNDVSVSGVAERGEHHITSVDCDYGTFQFDCPRSGAGIVKSLDWKPAKYEWVNANATWRLNITALSALIDAFHDDGTTVTVPVNVVEALGERSVVTETQRVTIDEDAAIGLDTYTPRVKADDGIAALPREPSVTANDVYGTSPSNPDRLSLMALDMSLADTGANAGLSIDLGANDLAELPASVKDEWQPSNTDDDDDAYEWYHPLTSARIRVQEVEGWGSEYELLVKRPYADELSSVVTVADERKAVLAAITHLKGLTAEF